MAERPLRVLLIEDNPTDTRLIREALVGQVELPVELTLAEDLSSGLRHLATGTVDLVLLDLMLPESQGLETLGRVHRAAPQVPIVVLTAFDDTVLGLEALQQGAQDYLVKGYVEVYPSLLGRSIRYTIERTRAARELLRLASFAEQDPNPIVEADSDGTVTYLNPSAREQFPDLATLGARHPVLQGMPDVVATLQARGKPFLVRELVCGHKVYEQRLYVPARGVVRSYSIEITERKQLERLKDEFLSTVSHELRTPMATVKEFIGIISDGVAGPLTPHQQQYLGTVRENIDRLARIIDDLLDMAKIEAGRLLLTKTLLEPAALIEHVCASLRPLAKSKGLTLEARLPARVPAVFADSDKLTQVLINLVSNAIKFTEPGGTVTVGLTEAPTEITFQVTDTGLGICPEDVPHLFEKFSQFAPRPLPGGTSLKGTGLGLAISKRLVELHGGTITVTSQPGVGSTFTVTLPQHQPDEVFREYLKSGLEQARRKQSRFSISVVAIPNFPELKALYGLEQAGRLLRELEGMVRATVRRRAGDVVIRWQRGEMVVILAEVDRIGAHAVAEELTQALRQGRAVTLNGKMLHVSIQTATATYPDEADTSEELLQVTETRLQQLAARKVRILVVDDEPKIRQFLKGALELQAYDVLTAAGGPEALTLLKEEPVDLILLDLMMDGMDGYEVDRLLKDNPKTRDIPVIVVTAKGNRKDRQVGLQHAAYNYVAKPFDLEDLLARIRDTLVRHHEGKS